MQSILFQVLIFALLQNKFLLAAAFYSTFSKEMGKKGGKH